MKREDWPSLKWLMSGSIYFVLRNGGGKKICRLSWTTAHSLFSSFIPFCYQNGGTNYSHVTPTFSTNIVSTPSSLLSAFFKTSLYLFDLIVSCVQLLHVSVSDKNQHALLCSFPKTAATRCEFHTTAAWWDLFFFFFSPQSGVGGWGWGGVCARDGEQWPNCWAATRLSPEDFLLNSGPPNSVWHATSWGEETRIIKKQREGDWGEPLMPSRLSQTLVRSPLERKKKSRTRCGFFFFFFSFAADRQTLSKRRRRVDVLTRARLLFHLFLCSNAFTS